MSLHSLIIGQKVWATVEEVVSENSLIVNFQGDLVRVENQTAKPLRPGSRIQLMVIRRHPIEFRLIEPRRISTDRKIDLEV